LIIMLDLGRFKNVNNSPGYCVTIRQEFCVKDPSPARCRSALSKPPKPPDIPRVLDEVAVTDLRPN
jgi:hypothetical protein